MHNKGQQYRALRRFQDADLTAHTLQHNPDGPDHKIFRLTESGKRVLNEFIRRNVSGVYDTERFKKLVEYSNYTAK